MIRIEITDPHLLPAPQLIKLAHYLLSLGGVDLKPAPIPQPKIDNSQEEIVDMQNLNGASAPIIPPPPPINIGSQPAMLNINLEDIRNTDMPAHSHITNATQITQNALTSVNQRSEELDASGKPWDVDLHTRTKSKDEHGLWKIKRNLIDTPPVPVMPTPQKVEDDTIDQPSFQDLMDTITKGAKKGKLTSAIVLKIVQEFGVPSLPVVGTRPDLIPGIIERLEGIIA